MDVQSKGRLLYLVSEDWYFCSHRLELAVAAQAAGYEVWVVTRVNSHGEPILLAGLQLEPLNLQRRGMNPFRDLLTFYKLFFIYRRIKPDIVHHVGLKPVIIGSLAARLAGCRKVINAFAGLGYVFSSNQLQAKLLKGFISLMIRRISAFPMTKTLVQNADDAQYFIKKTLCRSANLVLIKGSGVDTEKFRPAADSSTTTIVLLAARMIRDKGINDFVNAAAELKRRQVEARFVLVGAPDDNNATSIPARQLQDWHQQGVIEWWGQRDDMPQVIAAAHIAVLPTTYGEGIPKFLIEAASCGLPCVASDWPGCREIVRHAVNGLLVPPGDPKDLANVLETLIKDPQMRQRYGMAGRRMVKLEFSLKIVIDKTLELYGNK